MPLNPISFRTTVLLENIPVQWITYRFQFFETEFPQFPNTYIHYIINGKRVYGFPFLAQIKTIRGLLCDVEVTLLLNADFEDTMEQKDTLVKELSNRIGNENSIGPEDITFFCNGDSRYEAFLLKLWDYIKHIYGERIPFGRFYEEVDSIVRFVSAWNPKTGRQSELRMRYNFFSAFGEEIQVDSPWDFFSFFILPTADEILSDDLTNFPNFQTLCSGMSKIWNKYYTYTQVLTGLEINSMTRAWKINKQAFIDEVTEPLFNENIITLDEKMSLETLVDAFNRHAWRAAYFIWSIMTLKTTNFKQWSKEQFVDFYLNSVGVGLSEKVTACFLQQGFGNDEAIPVDTWIESFHKYALGIENRAEFFNAFRSMGKLERIIWLSSQANKINLKSFFNTLWCTRYGTRGNEELRQANPIACYECELRSDCPGYSKIKNEKVQIIRNTSANEKRMMQAAFRQRITFVCRLSNLVPKQVFQYKRKEYILIDEFSGYLLSNQTTTIEGTPTVEEFINSLPRFNKEEVAGDLPAIELLGE